MTKNKEVASGIRTWWLKNILFLGLAGALLLLTSGKIDRGMAWSYLAAMLLVVTANAIFTDPALLAERSKLQEGTKKWDIALAGFVAITGPLSIWAVSGLDIRFMWSQMSVPTLQLEALAVFVFGSLVVTWSMAYNKFFSSTVRIQNDRQHQVASGGPYRYVRHPGYSGGIIAMLATPLALGSWFALIPGVFVATGYILRTVLEDRVLLEELGGYKDYAEKVRCHLLPVIW